MTTRAKPKRVTLSNGTVLEVVRGRDQYNRFVSFRVYGSKKYTADESESAGVENLYFLAVVKDEEQARLMVATMKLLDCAATYRPDADERRPIFDEVA